MSVKEKVQMYFIFNQELPSSNHSWAFISKVHLKVWKSNLNEDKVHF